MSFGSRTLTDLGVRDLRNGSTRLKIFSGTANPLLAQVQDLLRRYVTLLVQGEEVFTALNVFHWRIRGV
jgi:hypothetical protein